MKKTCALGLDLATTTGYAWHRNPMPRPFLDAFRLPGDPGEVGKPAYALENWLWDLYDATKGDGPITHIFFEAQHISGNINIDTVYRLICLGGVVEKFAFQIHAHVYKVEISKWRKHFIGRGSGFKKTPDKKKYLPGEDPKDLALQRCADYGWHTDKPDAAEAAGILDFGLSALGEYHPRPWRDAAMMKAMQK